MENFLSQPEPELHEGLCCWFLKKRGGGRGGEREREEEEEGELGVGQRLYCKKKRKAINKYIN